LDNFFIAKDFDWQVRRSSNLDRALNRATRRVGINSDTAGLVDQMIYKLTGDGAIVVLVDVVETDIDRRKKRKVGDEAVDEAQESHAVCLCRETYFQTFADAARVPQTPR